MKRASRDLPPVDRREIDASAFAMALLMPEKMLRADVEALERHITLEDIDRLSKRYRVEGTIMTLRLVHLGYLR